jgi:hypothetical protein
MADCEAVALLWTFEGLPYWPVHAQPHFTARVTLRVFVKLATKLYGSLEN